MRNELSIKLESFLDDTMTYYDLPGLAIGVYCGQAATENTFCGVRGFADYVSRTPLHADDIFHCASVSKLFTATSIMKLVEADIIHLEDHLADLLPDLSIADKRYRDITLRHMLTHTSGLGDCADYHWDTPLFGEDALAHYVYSDEVCKQPMVWEAGKGFRYSNVAFEILGHIVSVYSDRMPAQNGNKLSYEAFVAENCLKPAHMTSSTMKTYERQGWHSDTAEWGDNNMAFPHAKDADRSIQRVQYYPYTRQNAPSSTLTSTTADLLRWGRIHLEGSRGDGHGIFADAAIYETIWTPYAEVPNNGEGIGLGWFIRKQLGHTLYGHEGSDDGFRSSFWICPDLDMVTVVLSNLSEAPVKKKNKKLFAAIAE